jgi:hypothetical protein
MHGKIMAHAMYALKAVFQLCITTLVSVRADEYTEKRTDTQNMIYLYTKCAFYNAVTHWQIAPATVDVPRYGQSRQSATHQHNNTFITRKSQLLTTA